MEANRIIFWVGAEDPSYVSNLMWENWFGTGAQTYDSIKGLCCKKSQLFSKGHVEGVIWARVWLTKLCIVWVCRTGVSLWGETSHEAILEGKEGDGNCETVNCG